MEVTRQNDRMPVRLSHAQWYKLVHNGVGIMINYTFVTRSNQIIKKSTSQHTHNFHILNTIRNREDYVYVKGEYLSTLQKISRFFWFENKVNKK